MLLEHTLQIPPQTLTNPTGEAQKMEDGYPLLPAGPNRDVARITIIAIFQP